MLYLGHLLRYKVLAEQICDYFDLELEHRQDYDTTDDDVIYPWYIWDIKGTQIAPTYPVSIRWDNKVFQYNQLKDIVPVPPYQVLDLPRLILSIRHMEKAFITQEHSLSGEGNMMYEGNPQEVIEAFRGKGVLRLSEYIPHTKDVSLHVIIGKDDIFISSICEQIIEGTSFRGGIFPCFLDTKVTEMIHEYTERIADVLRADGYIGLCGLDFMVCDNNDVYLCEVNPRKMGTTPFVSMQMEIDDEMALSCLEYHVNILDELPKIVVNKPSIGWKLRLLPHDSKHPKFEGREYFKQNGDYTYNDTYEKFSFEIEKWDLSIMSEERQ